MNSPCNSIMARLAAAIAPRYRVDGLIARGGMACVFKGFNTSLQVPVALKVLEPDTARVETVMRFEREGRVQAQLQDPHIVHVNDSLEFPGMRVLVMEFVEDGSLKDHLEQRGRLPLAGVQRIGRQILMALKRSHEAGVVHRDVKPGNIMLRKGQALLADFGIAMVPEWDDQTLTSPGVPLGTPAYMPTEQKLGYADHRSDLFALGITLRQCLLGLEGDAIRHPSEEAWRGVRSDVRAVIEKAIADHPEARWQSAEEFRKALEKTAEPLALRWRPAFLALAALALVYFLTSGRLAAMLCRWTGAALFCPAPPPAPAYDLAISPFVAADSATARDFGRLLSKDLDWFGAKQLMPMSRVQPWNESGRKQPLNATLYTDGRIQRDRDSLTVEIDVIASETGKVVQRVTLHVSVNDLQGPAHAMADSIVCKTFERDCAVFRSIAFRPVDHRATLEFFAGKDSVAKGNWRAGEEHFRRALQLDPGFMPAAWELMITKRFQREDHGADLQFIARNIDKVPDFYRKLAIASLTPDLRVRLRLLRAVVDSSQQNGTALLMYSNELFHRGALVGLPLRATLDTMRGMAATDPGMNHSSTYDMLWWGDMRLGLKPQAEAALRNREALGLPPGDTYKDFQQLGLYARFNPLMADVVRWLELRNPNDTTLALIHRYSRLATMMDVPAEQIALGTILATKGISTEQRVSGLVGKAEGHLMFGRPAQAFRLLDSALAQMPSGELELQKREWAVHLFTLGLVDDTALVAAARAWLADSAPAGAPQVRAAYALGRDALFTGDTARADSILAVLVNAPDTTPTANRHASLLGAELVAARGDPAGALAMTEVIYLRDTTTVRLSPFARAVTYLNRGQWQERLQRHAEADREWLWHENADFEGWPVGAPQEGEVDAILSVYARLIRGEHEIKHGNIVLACRHLLRARELWVKTEPVMRPLVARTDSAIKAARCH